MPRRVLPALHPAGIALGALLTGLGIFFAELVLGPLLSRTLTDTESRILGQVHGRLREDYVRPLDGEWLMQRGLAGMIESLDDPYSFFVGPEMLAALEEESTGHLIGIGVILDGRDHVVRWPVPGGPAEKAGLRPGDRILAVDGESVADLALDEVVARLKGPAGTLVHLDVQTLLGERSEVDVVRSPVPTGTVGKIAMVDRDLGIGTILIRSFADSTEDELERALERLRDQGLRALVLDLRFNAGGLLNAAVGVAARFVDGGVICTLRDRSRMRVLEADPALAVETELPLVVLVNDHSASGSEVLAGALRDRGAALLVGERSFGKGVFQQVHRYPSAHFAYKFTAGYYLTPSGRVLEGHLAPDRAGGLEPDVPVPVDAEQKRALATWMNIPEPPDVYREVVFRLFENVALLERPEDPAFDTAVEILRRALQGA